MEDKVKKLEELLGSKYEDWTEDTLTKIITSEEAISLFTPEMVVHLLLNKKNENITDILVPIKYGFDLRAIKSKIEEQLKELKENNKPLEDFKRDILVYKEINNPIFKLAVFLTELAAFGPDYDVSKEEESIRSAISDFKKILIGLKLDEGFQVLLELFDLLFPVKELYFQRYNVDLLKDDKEIEDVMKRVNKKTKEMADFMSQMEKESKENPIDNEEK
jgi:hypothetical protein